MADGRMPPFTARGTDTVHPGVRDSPTAYNGAAGHINDAFVLDAREADEERRDSHQSQHSAKSVSPQREGFGSRLLSTLSNAQPAAAALRRSGSVLHSRTRSWAAYVPKLPANPISATDKTSHASSNRIFGDLFNGESAPIRLGVPSSNSQEDTEFVMEYRPGFTERPIKRPQRIDTSLSVSQPGQRSSWFGRKSITPATPLPSTPQDEFLSMNINNALFPDGPADPLSPHAFNDLLINATNLLQRMQAAYREKVEYINSIRPEMDAQKEETEEADTRAQHLKLQLEDLGRRTQEQDRVNRELTVELLEARLKLQDSQPKTVRLVQRPGPDNRSPGEPHRRDGVTPRKFKRTSAGSVSDSGFESDAETASMFSTTNPDFSQPQMTLTAPPDYEGSAWGGQSSIANGMVVAAGRRDANNRRMIGENAVWSTVEKLRSENTELQKQLDDIRSSIGDCIDFIGGITGK